MRFASPIPSNRFALPSTQWLNPSAKTSPSANSSIPLVNPSFHHLLLKPPYPPILRVILKAEPPFRTTPTPSTTTTPWTGLPPAPFPALQSSRETTRSPSPPSSNLDNPPKPLQHPFANPILYSPTPTQTPSAVPYPLRPNPQPTSSTTHFQSPLSNKPVLPKRKTFLNG